MSNTSLRRVERGLKADRPSDTVKVEAPEVEVEVEDEVDES